MSNIRYYDLCCCFVKLFKIARISHPQPIPEWWIHATFVANLVCQIKVRLYNTDMEGKAKVRLRELALTARGSWEAGFTHPSLRLSCMALQYKCFRPEMQLNPALYSQITSI